MNAQPSPINDTMSYAQAVDELAQLLAELEAADVDVDRLTEQVARGVELVRFCRARLDIVSAEVDGVMTDLANPASLDDPPDANRSS